jgi:GT2 family glycosyltransferase
MVEAAEPDSRIGSVASVIIDGNKPGILDSCGVGIALDGMSRQRMRGMPVPVLGTPEEILMASGCACLFRADALKTTGLFDEDFFAYCEDTDLGLRLRWAGFKTVVAPGAEVTHYYSMTAGKYSLKKVFWVERNHLWVAVMNFPVLLLLILPHATGWRYVVQVYAILSRSGDLADFTGQSNFIRVMMTVIKASLSAIFGIPSMLRKRFLYQQKRNIGHYQMVKTILNYRMSIFEIIVGSGKAS